MPKIAALLTVHNRCQLTLACLSSLFEQVLPTDFVIQVYLVDDGSSDGTTHEVLRCFPAVDVIQGDGTLFWCGGMRRAWAEAAKGQYDYYLWLNDDTTLLPGAIGTLLGTADQLRGKHGRDAIVVGSTRDPETGSLTFGGKLLSDFSMVEPSDTPQPCDMMNGNVALIPRAVFEVVGNLSADYTHAIGDHDYSLRAVYKGIPVYVGPGYFGECKATISPLWVRPEIPLRQRWRALHGPKGLPPSEYSVFLRQHLPSRRLWLLFKLYTRAVIPFLWQ